MQQPHEAGVFNNSSPLSQAWPLQFVGKLWHEPNCLVQVDVRQGRLGDELQCNSVINEPALLYTIFNGPHFGHVLGNGINDVYRTLLETNLTAGICRYEGCEQAQHGNDAIGGSIPSIQDVRLFSTHCQVDHGREHLQVEASQELMPIGPFDFVLQAMSGGNPVRSWRHLLRHSEASGEVVCMRQLTVGLSNGIDLYVSSDPEGLRRFGAFVKAVASTLLPPGALPGLDKQPQLARNHGADQQILHWFEAEEEEEEDMEHQWEGRHWQGQQQQGQRRTATPFHVAIISRVGYNRKILNEQELQQGLQQLLLKLKVQGTVDLVLFDAMDELQQVQVASQVNLLVGMDGTGLLQSFFMPFPCGAVVKINTYRMQELVPRKGANFKRVAAACAGEVLEWNCTDPEAVQLPQYWHDKPALRDLLLYGKEEDLRDVKESDKNDFMKQQDVTVDMQQVVELAEQALEGMQRDRGCEFLASSLPRAVSNSL